VALTRNEPDFVQVGSTLGAPLADPFLSRKPIRFERGRAGSVVLHVDHGGTAVASGEPIAGRREITAAEIARGFPLELADRVVLVLHEVTGDALTQGAAEAMGMVGHGAGIVEVRAHVRRVADLQVPVLVRGETGTGKELVAEAVIEALGRAGKPRASVNVAAIPAGVFEGQLFGWEKGAYSGAEQAGRGIFRLNEGGSVFLDEIGELSLELQPKLLRLIENRAVQPVGGGRPVPVDVAVVAASNRPLAAAVEKGSFRRDLLARFTARLVLPPLAERPEDVLAILRSLALRRGLSLDESRADVEGVERLLLGPWPANVRDLDRIAAELVARGRLTSEVVESVLGRRATSVVLTHDLAEQMLRECSGNEHEVERRYGVKRGKLRRALGKVGKGRPVS
jgi:transcriptional regulator with GAF, ATPase, and Fis domain